MCNMNMYGAWFCGSDQDPNFLFGRIWVFEIVKRRQNVHNVKTQLVFGL
jgi:hypothetical protein